MNINDDLQKQWEMFLLNNNNNNNNSDDIQNTFKRDTTNTSIPKGTELYISTKTKISYLTHEVDLQKIFWKIPTIEYHNPKIGVVKKQMKFNFMDKESVSIVEEKLLKEKNVEQNIITQIVNPDGRIKFKDIRKVSIGLCKKDITSYRSKKKSAFYNCFVMIMRILYNDIYREIHVKVFNTGKLEIPGIQSDDLLEIVLNTLIDILKPISDIDNLSYKKELTETVLINSNFNCGFYINREKLFDTLKYKYQINSSYDPCSYPGIQCEFYYDDTKSIQIGKQPTELNENIHKISFMIFRTGSVLIVGKCDDDVLYIIYDFIKQLLIDEFHDIYTSTSEQDKTIDKKKSSRKKLITTFT